MNKIDEAINSMEKQAQRLVAEKGITKAEANNIVHMAVAHLAFNLGMEKEAAEYLTRRFSN